MPDQESCGRGFSRRQILGTIAAAGAAAAFPASRLYGQFIDKSTAKGGRIDLHHHHVPPALVAVSGLPRGFGGDRFP